MDTIISNENVNAETVETVIKNVEAYTNENEQTPTHKKKHSRSSTRFFKFLNLVWNIADAFGYRVESRIKVTDIKTGKTWE